MVMRREVYFKTVKALILALEARAYYLRGHSGRVTNYAILIGKRLNIPKEQLKLIKTIGLLHDLGKIALSDVLLNKSGSLTVAERQKIQLHPVIGAMILNNLGFLQEDICIVRNHHERYDGMGYPDKLKEEDIPLLARIFSVADAFDAMTSDRPYRKRMSIEKATGELVSNKGTQFDPAIVDTFLSNTPKTPPEAP